MATRKKAGPVQYEIEGLTAFRRELKRLEVALPVSVRDLNVDAAKRIVEEGRDRADTRQQKKAAKSLRASRSASYVAVLLGDNRRYAFALGAEFGARHYKQFPAWRGNQWSGWDSKPGYFLHPAVRHEGEQILDEYWKSIRVLAARAFPD